MPRKKAVEDDSKQPTPSDALRLEWLDPDSLSDNPVNWRRHPEGQVTALRDVMAQVGWAGALLYNSRTKRLIDGHARKKLFARKGEPVPVLVGSWDESQEKIILATLDPLAAMAEADTDLYTKLLASVKESSPGLQQALEGIVSGSGLAELLTPPLPAPGGGGDEFDATPAETGPTRTNVGELWVIGGKHRLLVGDCTVKENVERLMGGGKAKAMVTDPPYAVDYVEKARDMNCRGYVHSRSTLAAAIQGDGLDEDDARGLWQSAFTIAFDVALDEHAAIYIWHAQGRAMLTLYNLLTEMGVLQHQTIIWVKHNFVIGRCDYQWQHEPCFYGWKKGSRPEFYGTKNQTTVWQFPRDTNSPEHPTQKPVAIFLPPMTNHLRDGEIAYDPFLGSGTTLIAAHRFNRRCFGLELEPRYADVILRRCEAENLTVEKSSG